MYWLEDVVGEATVHRALARMLEQHAFEAAPYLNTLDFLRLLRAEAGPEHDASIIDLFERIAGSGSGPLASDRERIRTGNRVRARERLRVTASTRSTATISPRQFRDTGALLHRRRARGPFQRARRARSAPCLTAAYSKQDGFEKWRSDDD